MSKIPYRLTVCSLLWLATSTHPDIAPTIHTVCRFSSNPGKQHCIAVKRILRYLKGTADMGITLGGFELEINLEGFTNADWAGDLDT